MSPELQRSIDEFISSNKVVVFMKGEKNSPQVSDRLESLPRPSSLRWFNASIHLCEVQSYFSQVLDPYLIHFLYNYVYSAALVLVWCSYLP